MIPKNPPPPSATYEPGRTGLERFTSLKGAWMPEWSWSAPPGSAVHQQRQFLQYLTYIQKRKIIQRQKN